MFCWLPALTIAVTRLVRGDHELPIQENFPLYLIQGVTAPSQGFLNCLVYGWTRKSFRRASSEPTPETVTTPLVKTTYRTYGVASARKTFKRSTVESATPSPTETPSPKPIDS
ncbi:transmembrane protein 116-like [Ptychodera flava]|uniref:transmembrane protein 116-like n=1 Tax=Ptychodera flava TaxID=63121 RepID=UPI003969C49C